MAGLIDVTESLLKSIVTKASPLLGAMLGTPISGILVSLLSNLFGSERNNLSDLLAKIQNDPEAAIKIKQIENAHAESLAKMQNDSFALETADKQDARKYAEVYKTFLIQMAFLVTGGFFGVLVLLFIPLDISDSGKNLLSMLVGMLASKWQTIIDFFFGASHLSKSKIKV